MNVTDWVVVALAVLVLILGTAAQVYSDLYEQAKRDIKRLRGINE